MTDKEIVYNSLIPELSVSNIDKKAFTVHANSYDNWNIGKLEHPYGRGINLSMTVSNIEKMYEILKEKNIKFFLDLEIHEYRIDDKISYDKEFLIQDPDGYLLRFNN